MTVDEPLPDVLVEAPDLYPSCAITWAQAKLQSTSPKLLPPLPQVQEDLINQPLSQEELIKTQNSDPVLVVLQHFTVARSELDTLSTFYFSDGVLMMIYRPPSLTKGDSWAETHQVVLPTSMRSTVCFSLMAHDSFTRHLGVRKIYHFYWPGIKEDVTQFVRTCHIFFHLTGKVNKPIPPSPLFFLLL